MATKKLAVCATSRLIMHRVWLYEEVCKTHCCTCNKKAVKPDRRGTCGIYGNKSVRQCLRIFHALSHIS